jgi:hypothetical protein
MIEKYSLQETIAISGAKKRQGKEAWMKATEDCEPYINSLLVSLIRPGMEISFDFPFKPPMAET